METNAMCRSDFIRLNKKILDEASYVELRVIYQFLYHYIGHERLEGKLDERT